jgi:hypothetical protein
MNSRYTKLATLITIALLSSVACDSRSDIEKCTDDPKCSAAMEAVDRAAQTVDTVCPKDENQSNEACDAALNTLNSAQELQGQLQPK